MYEAIDLKMKEEIAKIATDNLAEKMQEIWLKDISKEEEKSKAIWLQKEIFLTEYATNYGKETPSKKRQTLPSHKWKGQKHSIQTKNLPALNPQIFTKEQQTKRNNNRSRSPRSRTNFRSINKSTSRTRQVNRPRLFSEVVKNGYNVDQGRNRSVNPNFQPQIRNIQQNSKMRQPNKQYRSTNPKKIHFLVSGHVTPDREKVQEETLLKTINM